MSNKNQEGKSLEEKNAVDRLFKICQGQVSCSPKELDHLLLTYPNSARAKRRFVTLKTDYTTTETEYPLHIACWKAAPTFVIRALVAAWPGAVSTPNRFIRHRCYDNDRIEDGGYPLHLAARNHRTCVDTLACLVDAWPDAIKQKGGLYGYPLQAACSNFKDHKVNIDNVILLMNQWPRALLATDKDGFSVFHVVCESKSALAIVRAMSPEAVRIRNENGVLPLHVACNAQLSLPVIQSLVQAAPESVRVPTEAGNLPLHLICHRLHNKGEEYAPMILKILVDAWPESLQIPAAGGMMPLHTFCADGAASTDWIDYLIDDYPQALYMPANFMELPLHKACQNYLHRNEDIIALLMYRGPDAVQVCTVQGRLPLHILCHGNASFELRQTLTRMWPEAIRIQDTYGFLPLHYACNYPFLSPDEEELRQHVQFIKFLVDMWPESLQVVTYGYGMSPLYFACQSSILVYSDLATYLNNAYPLAVRIKTIKRRLLPLHFVCSRYDTFPLETIRSLVRARPESVHEVPFENDYHTHQSLPVLDMVCSKLAKSAHDDDVDHDVSSELCLILTHETPPLHFACTYIHNTWTGERFSTLKFLLRLFPNDRLQFHHGKLPLHCACRSGAPLLVLEFWWQQSPEAFCIPTKDTGDTPLHCYLSSYYERSTMDRSNTMSCVEFLME